MTPTSDHLQGLSTKCLSLSGILFILISPFLCYLISWLQFKAAVKTEGRNKAPPTIPYTIPFLFHLLAFAWDPFAFVSGTL